MMAGHVLLKNTSNSGRQVVWPVIESEVPFGKQLILSLAGNHHSVIPDVVDKWGEEAAADIYLWLHQQFPLSTDPDPEGVYSPGPRHHVADWRRRLLASLEHRGSRSSVLALQRIRQETGLVWLGEVVRSAKMALRQRSWVPATPAELFTIIRDRESRLVRNGSELMKVVGESLRRFNDELHGENPLARLLWHPSGGTKWRPRDEGDLADAIQRHLGQDLSGRGIVAGREIVIRRGGGGAPGHRTDLYVYAMVAGRTEDDVDTLSLVIEVKGSWNAGLVTSMETQLVQDYLSQNQHAVGGLYVAGWYSSPAWDPGDRRRARANAFPTAASLETVLMSEARRLRKTTRTQVQAIVLDVSLGIVPPSSVTVGRSRAGKGAPSSHKG